MCLYLSEREFVGDLRKITALSIPSPMSVVQPPIVDAAEPSLTFVALHVADSIALQLVGTDEQDGSITLGRFSKSPRSTPDSRPSSLSSLSKCSRERFSYAVHSRVAPIISDSVAICAAQTGGYIAHLVPGAPTALVVFAKPHAAACFAAALQMALLTASYDQEALSHTEPEVKAADGRWVFRGARVAVAVHTGTEWTAQDNGSSRQKVYTGMSLSIEMYVVLNRVFGCR
jgi:hypothetical protein